MHGKQCQCVILLKAVTKTAANCNCYIYRVRLKKMTQHQKCDYSVTPENFCAKFCILVQQGPVH